MNTNSSQTSDTWLKRATALLKNAGIPTARLDALILLEDTISRDRGWLLAHPELLLPPVTLNLLAQQIERRQNHEPLAYIRGKSEFYGREFVVTPHTLQPRPETEAMIELLKQTLKEERWKMEDGMLIVDVGTGSGCLGITAKLEFPKAEVIATDIDPACIKIAKQSAKKLGADIGFYQGDLLQHIPSSTFHLLPSILLANLPYVPDGHTINQAAMFEPRQAIFGGADGLNLYRRLFKQITNLPKKPQYILTESLPFQHSKVAKTAMTAGYTLSTTQDFIQLFKLVSNSL